MIDKCPKCGWHEGNTIENETLLSPYKPRILNRIKEFLGMKQVFHIYVIREGGSKTYRVMAYSLHEAVRNLSCTLMKEWSEEIDMERKKGGDEE